MEYVWVFETPEKHGTNDSPVYHVSIRNSHVLPFDLHWNGKELEPNVGIQTPLMTMKTSLLNALAENKSLFRNPPTVKSLHALASMWGIAVLRDSTCKWSDHNVWEEIPEVIREKRATVQLKLAAVRISRSTISPVWSLGVVEILPDPKDQTLIDFDFMDSNDDSDVKSVHSTDILEDDTVDIFHLQDIAAKKRAVKEHVREMLRLAGNARLAADDAIDRFYSEYDLSENESDFSDEEDV